MSLLRVLERFLNWFKKQQFHREESEGRIFKYDPLSKKADWKILKEVSKIKVQVALKSEPVKVSCFSLCRIKIKGDSLCCINPDSKWLQKKIKKVSIKYQIVYWMALSTGGPVNPAKKESVKSNRHLNAIIKLHLCKLNNFVKCQVMPL